jgi:hypothetical protein
MAMVSMAARRPRPRTASDAEVMKLAAVIGIGNWAEALTKGYRFPT